MTKTMRIRICVAVALTAVVACVFPGTADARGRDVVSGRYLALGDSFVFGYSPLLEDPWIPERFVGYPEIIGQKRSLTTTNLACPGQTAQALISLDAVDGGCFETREEFQDHGLPFLKADYRGTQLEAALDAVRSDTPPSLISMQGGGNDWLMCAFDSPDPKQCLEEQLPNVTASLREAVKQLRAAGFQGRIVLVGYHLVEGFEKDLRRVNRAIRLAAAQPTCVVSRARSFPFGQYARRHHGDLCSTGLLVALPDGSCDPLHPSLIGHQLIADAVLEAARG